MSANAELARIFLETATILELTGASSFRVSAYSKAARALEDLATDIAQVDPESIDGIGSSTAAKIREYLESGKIDAHEKLRQEIPLGLLDVLAVPGLGPKTVRLLWTKGGITDLDSLQKAAESGALEDLPRLGKKSIENIKASIDFMRKHSERIRLGSALPAAEAIANIVTRLPGVTRATYAGSVRRGRETIGDLDILASTNDPEGLAEAFTSMDGVERVLVSGGTKCSVRLEAGIQVDLRIVPEDAFGAALLYFTGSKEHNVRLRERAIKSGMRLNEYGLFPDDGDETPPQQRGISAAAAAEEADIYAALELPWIPPELREDRGEFEASDVIDELVSVEDIGSDLHAHTVASDGTMSIDELADVAVAHGLHTIAVTDHSKSSAIANGLDEDRLRRHVDAVHEANDRRSDITILAGSEVDILADGSLDYDDEVLGLLDIVVASPHASLRQDSATATERLLRAIHHPLVDIIGHPTGRIIGRRQGLEPDLGALIEASLETRTALEINANSMRLDLRDTHVRAVAEAGGLIAIDTDTHKAEQMDQLRYGILTARRGWLRRSQCVNAWSADELRSWLGRNR